MGERTAKASQRGFWAVWAEEITKCSVIEEPCWDCRACRLFPSSIATAMSVVLFQLMMHQGKTGALPPLHTSTLAESLRSQTQNAACHVGALEVHRMTCNPLHLATRSQPINRQSKGDQGQGSPGGSTFQAVGSIQANSWGLFRWIMRARTERLPYLTGSVTQFTVGRLLCALLWPGLYWAGMRANAPYLCGQSSHWLDWRACSSYSHGFISAETTAGWSWESPQKLHQGGSTASHKGHLPFPRRLGPSRAFVLIPR